MSNMEIKVNGKVQRLNEVDAQMPLLYALRDNLALHGPKFGCGKGQCGACTVMLDGVATRSCVTSLAQVGKRAVTTLEGLGSSTKPSVVQQAFIAEQAAQCGYCINGMVVTATALLARNRNPSEAQIREALAENLCRCGTHTRSVKAVQRAAKAMASGVTA